jgi:hypothetical protein
VSLKRTVLDLRAEAEAVVDEAWAKSSESSSELGWVSVAAVEGLEKPWNWDVRSSNCFCRDGRASEMMLAPLIVANPLI